MNRNSIDRFSNVPTPHMPRTKQKFPIRNRLQTMRHGHLIPFYCRLMYPHSTLKHDMTAFIRMDTSLKVPLDNVYLDNYYFWIPLRILDKDFEKRLGHKDVYDDGSYPFPLITLDVTDSNHAFTHDSILNYLGYGAYTDTGASPSALAFFKSIDADGRYFDSALSSNAPEVNAYPLAAYCKIWNEYFRDENLDAEIPIDDILAGNISYHDDLPPIYGLKYGEVLPVNRYHDIFSSGLVSPIKGGNGDVLIPMGNPMIPVITGNDIPVPDGGHQELRLANTASSSSWLYNSSLRNLVLDQGQVSMGNTTSDTVAGDVMPSNLWADMRNNGASVNQLYLSLALYSLYDKRGTFGTRLIEQIRGSFGLEVPDGLLDRVEYLGGSSQTLNNVPVLNTADDLGEMRGNSATLTGLNSFEKSFNEWGLVIGVSCTRVKHVYNQGIVNPSLMLKDYLDMYWPEFANISKVGIPNYRIWNANDSYNNEIFNFNEPWIDEHTEIDFAAGDFGCFHGPSTELREKWTYQDIYIDRPYFSGLWLKEDETNIKRTLSSSLIPGSTNSMTVDTVGGKDYFRGVYGHQFMVKYTFRTELTEPIPVRSQVPNITGRI